jgi:hypothetical protein
MGAPPAPALARLTRRLAPLPGCILLGGRIPVVSRGRPARPPATRWDASSLQPPTSNLWHLASGIWHPTHTLHAARCRPRCRPRGALEPAGTGSQRSATCGSGTTRRRLPSSRMGCQRVAGGQVQRHHRFLVTHETTAPRQGCQPRPPPGGQPDDPRAPARSDALGRTRTHSDALGRTRTLDAQAGTPAGVHSFGWVAIPVVSRGRPARPPATRWDASGIQQPRPTSHVPRPTSHVPRPTSHVPCPMSHVPRPTSHVPCPMSHVPCPMSHVPCPMSHVPCKKGVFEWGLGDNHDSADRQ